jgi:hypothetical protein
MCCWYNLVVFTEGMAKTESLSSRRNADILLYTPIFKTPVADMPLMLKQTEVEILNSYLFSRYILNWHPWVCTPVHTTLMCSGSHKSKFSCESIHIWSLASCTGELFLVLLASIILFTMVKICLVLWQPLDLH